MESCDAKRQKQVEEEVLPSSPGAKPSSSETAVVLRREKDIQHTDATSNRGRARGGRGRGRGRGRSTSSGRARAADSQPARQHCKRNHTQEPGCSSYAEDLPEHPVEKDHMQLLHDRAGVNQDESFGEDERKLNEFLTKHPMLTLEATSQSTLEMLSNIFNDKGMASVCNLPVVGKSYDDTMLRPANKSIGERDCVCGQRCMATFLAHWRHGKDTDLAFVCTEYLLPSERDAFISGNGLPTRRKKCLLCTRYFTSFLYYKARVDPNFKLEDSGVSAQSFLNPIALDSEDTPVETTELINAQKDVLQSASLVSSSDGYKASAMLFVDEEFFNKKAGRKGPLAPLNWQPVVKFSSMHYKFAKDDSGGPFVVQVGIGVNQAFGKAPAVEAVAPLGQVFH